MTVSVLNAQRDVPVRVRRMARVARCMAQGLGIGGRGHIAISLISARGIRRINNAFLRRDHVTDVLSFRYGHGVGGGHPGGRMPIVGEILIAPSEARRFATRHRIGYHEELARYVAHGLLHWLGYQDATEAGRRAMRRHEDRLLSRCRAFARSA